VLALLEHAEDGNHTGSLKTAKKELIDYLTHRKVVQ
jgi:hypothetical protein